MQKHTDLPPAFAELGLGVPILRALAKIGFSKPSDIQSALIPVALTGRDVLGQAKTGTGKTAAFSLPILQRMDPAGRLQAICLVPTRELAVQVAGEVVRLAEFTGIHVVAVYGGQKIATQLHSLGRKPQFMVGTPGRVMDFLQRGAFTFADLEYAVLDEVDRMLDIGFRDDIKTILSKIHRPHQTIFVSATIDDEIRNLARRYMREPSEINVSHDKLTVDEVDQWYVTVDPHDKFAGLMHIMRTYDPPMCIVFCNTKHGARKLSKKLFDAGINAKEIHGDLDQQKRERVMGRFRKHQLRVLVATDLAARGIDVSAISHIINYDIPQDAHVYVHRIGRTGRMGARGTAISLVTRDQGDELTKIEMLINREVRLLSLDGFQPRNAPPPPAAPTDAAQSKSAVSSRLSAPVSKQPPATPAVPGLRPLPRTLGSKFRRPRYGRR